MKSCVTFVDFERERKETEKPNNNNNNNKQELWACLCSSVGKYARLSFVGKSSARASEYSRTSPLPHRNGNERFVRYVSMCDECVEMCVTGGIFQYKGKRCSVIGRNTNFDLFFECSVFFYFELSAEVGRIWRVQKYVNLCWTFLKKRWKITVLIFVLHYLYIFLGSLEKFTANGSRKWHNWHTR